MDCKESTYAGDLSVSSGAYEDAYFPSSCNMILLDHCDPDHT